MKVCCFKTPVRIAGMLWAWSLSLGVCQRQLGQIVLMAPGAGESLRALPWAGASLGKHMMVKFFVLLLNK